MSASEPQYDELHRLLSTASAALDNDHDTARACIVRAKTLLRIRGTAPKPSPGRPIGGLAQWQIRRLLVHIQAHLSGPLKNGELAALVGLSTSHFSRAFRQSFGEAPMRYVCRQRVLRAKELILDPRTTLANAALACGLCDQAHLTRLFRRFVGIPPASWRRQLRGFADEGTGPE